MKTALSFVIALMCLAAEVSAQPVVFLVRHAERADAGMAGGGMMANDPELSEAGRARAQSLASVLKEAGITAIFTTEFKRTRQTAEPLARALHITPTVVSSKDLAALVAQVRAAKGNVLAVGHSNTVPETIAALGVRTPVTIGDSDYDNLFMIVRGRAPSLVRLHFR